MSSVLTSPSVGENFTRQQAAEYLNLSKATLATWASRNRGPAFVRMGAAVRYPKSALDAFIASRTVTPTESSSFAKAQQIKAGA